MQTTKKLYQIYTEDKFRVNTCNLVSEEFSGFSVISATGFYKEFREDAIIIEIIGDCNISDSVENLRYELEKVRRIAQRIKSHNKQESVILTVSTIKVEEV